ncbi:chemotaxis-specific protein-glutamate methyltransferase CheB [Geomonas sp. RF6]|uniref:chemotaxis-specific protein-glutamate methyltransferase CheB n=1 Tax=Geomonas sp. RF6 TaxID=2897342 RepID=UPI001E5E0680|nr:chemotaxis-specific protein-glutamate methyltransferase CheB [Geomonas sp. RF6]UFS69420.1 chemotaxis-specific protein-glutamate methyltransferase CheB [Geomonas sp. RF6]
MVKVLVVDDSPVAQALLVHVLGSDPEIEVIGTARNGTEAIAVLEKKRPDVVTMDLHMHGMDGFVATRRIMTECPVPVVIVSGSIDPKLDTTIFQAIEAGAVAILLRPPGVEHPEHRRAAAELVQTVKLMSEVKVVRRFQPRTSIARPHSAALEEALTAPDIKVIAIGASTGGPIVVKRILSGLPRTFPIPILVVQHMAEGFVEGFAEWLAQACAIRVKVGSHGEFLAPGVAYVGPSGFELGIDRHGKIELARGKAGAVHCPTVGHLFDSVAQSFGRHAVGVLLTGMGSDGAQGLKRLKGKGAITIAQDKESSVIFGMPGEAVKLGAAQHVLPPDAILRMLTVLGGKTTAPF